MTSEKMLVGDNFSGDVDSDMVGFGEVDLGVLGLGK